VTFVGRRSEDSPKIVTRGPLEGALVRLRPLEPDDAAVLNPMFGDPEILEHLSFPFPQSEAGFREYVASARGDDSRLVLAIETLDGEAIGGIDLRAIDPGSRAATLGIWIGRPHWNRGYGTDAVRTLCRFGFRHMNLQRIELHVYETNPRGRRAYEKVGFRLEGTLRRAQFVGGRYVDTHVMGLLAEELVEG